MNSSLPDWMSTRELERVLLVDEVHAFANVTKRLMMMKELAISCNLRNVVLLLVPVLLVLLPAVQDHELLSAEMIVYSEVDDLSPILLLLQWHLARLLLMSGPCSTAALFVLGFDLCG